jgi:hypothetical protein
METICYSVGLLCQVVGCCGRGGKSSASMNDFMFFAVLVTVGFTGAFCFIQ